VWDIQRILEPLDPAWAGFYFDPAQATAEGGVSGWEIAMRLALPRVKAVTIQDFFWEKQDGHWRMVKCPLGQGMVDWPKFFRILAQSNFTGPITLEIAYPVKDMPSALTRELQFARKQVQAAWPSVPKT
jgi:sugar phosphate isomerase/epimerase